MGPPFEPSTYHILPPHSLACPHDNCTMNDVAFVPINMIETNRKQFKVYFIHVRAYAIMRGYDEVVVRVIDFTP